MIEELLTVDEVAAILRKPVGTLYYWRSKGDCGPDSFKVGSTVLYERSEVERYIAAQREATSAHRRAS